ncbi:protein with unknown function [Dorcoceras hygrometricum]|uniref:IST1-like protein n=1 Tax=Dorcoceras hygrometricum TaxID=472368 RepID=A0A2Z7BAU8_9LAMI|nr:protein with unknown function [Dorcoceras hygrometricum]
MAMLDSFFNKRFNASKCKTLLKLTIPRIKLLRNRREIQLKQMRREIAKLLETGQEATARIRVEHIIREEKMMAAQEIVELFSELISVRLPVIEAQKECPLDLKEAIASVCFAAPRCADLPELLQVQILFAGKYGKEFVSSATELMPECGVNRQLVELLSIRAPAPDVKLKLLKEIAEEHELDWDPSASESELLKPHEDLLNGPTQFVSGSKLPLPKEKHDGMTPTTSDNAISEHSDSDEEFDIIDFPEVPKQPLQSNKGTASAPEMLPFPASAFYAIDDQEETKPYEDDDNLPQLKQADHVQEKPAAEQSPYISAGSVKNKQFQPVLYSPSQTSSFSVRESNLPPTTKTKGESMDLQDVVAAAHAAAESAERAAAAARSAASIAQLRISGLAKNNQDDSVSTVEDNFHLDKSKSSMFENVGFDKQKSFGSSDSPLSSPSQNNGSENHPIPHHPTSHRSSDDSSSSSSPVLYQESGPHQPQRLPSMDDEPYFSYPNLFTSQASNLNTGAESFKEPK